MDEWQRTTSVVLLTVALSAANSASVFAQTTVDSPQAAAASTSQLGIASSVSGFQPLLEKTPESPQKHGIDWGPLVRHSLFFLGVENAFRCATEQGTRDGFGEPFFAGYLKAVGNLHGWDDGDPFYVNYIGHPMQGAVTGYMWTHADRGYRDIVFGENRKYWKGKLRAAAFSYIYSVLFEIGPISEASIGNIQAYYPEQGFVDHVVTPAIGSGWSIAEDTLDRYLVGYIEGHTTNMWARLVARVGLNPARTTANVMSFITPWHRDNRPGIEFYRPEDREVVAELKERNTFSPLITPPVGVAPFEFSIVPQYRTYFGDGHGEPCMGGGGSGAIRLAPEWQMVVDVGGCKLLGLRKNFSGDSLNYLAGARRTFHASNRWSVHAQVLIGGTKLTQEYVNRQQEQALDLAAEQDGKPLPPHADYSQHWETNGFTIQAASGFDVKLNNALSVRVGNVGYSRSWSNNINGFNYQRGLQFTSGLVLRMGTW